MKLSTRSLRRVAACTLLVTAASGCRGMSKTEQGAAGGAGLGALVGAIIGNQTGNRDLGALVGGATGGVAGATLGKNAELADERDAAIAQAHYQQRQNEANLRAVTNRDIINMSQQGLPDQTIVNSIYERGGRLDTSPDQLINLKRMQVSDQVIRAMQDYNARSIRR